MTSIAIEDTFAYIGGTFQLTQVAPHCGILKVDEGDILAFKLFGITKGSQVCDEVMISSTEESIYLSGYTTEESYGIAADSSLLYRLNTKTMEVENVYTASCTSCRLVTGV